MHALAMAALRGAVLLAVALALMPLLRRSSAALRRAVLVVTFIAVLVVPLATALLPPLHLGSDEPAPIAHAPIAAVEPVLRPTQPLANPQPVFVAPAAPAPAAPWSPLPLIVGVWALGALAVLARLGVGLARARRMAREARLLAVHHGVQVRATAAVDTPAVVGVFTPVVLLPDDADSWSAERRDLVLAHELAHVARRDTLAHALAQLAVALHWFDPLAWLAARRLRLERELAADDRVLATGARASSYAQHLLDFAASERLLPHGALGMAERSQVEVRIRALLCPCRSHAPLARMRAVLLATTGALIAGAVACATPDSEPAAPVTERARTVEAQPAGSTIDPQIQAIVDDEIGKLEAEWGPCAAVAVVLDPATGHVLALGHRGGTETTAAQAGARSMMPGSTFKPLVIAAALDEGVITASETFSTTPLPTTMYAPAVRDEHPHGPLDARGILAKSSNVGLARVFDKLGGARLTAWTQKFHLAQAPAQIADGARGAPIAIGANLASTPLELSAAFATLANGGVYHAPTFTSTAARGERVMREDTARTVLGMLESVTQDGGTGTAAQVAGIRVAGKTGTAHLGSDPESDDYYASFIGAAPLEQPRYVVFVGAETPRAGGYGGKVAAPVFSRIVTRVLRGDR